MPDALAGRGIKRDQRISKEIVANAIATVKIEDGRTSGHIDNAALLVDGHAGPVIGSAGVFPRVFGPSVVAELSRTRDGVEGPAQGSGAYIKRANVAGRRRMRFRVRTADDDQ